MQELADSYKNCKPDSEPLQYADLSEWQNESLQADGAEVGIDFWRKQQVTSPELLLPYEKPQADSEFQPAQPVSLSIDAHLTEKLEALSLRNGTTLSSTLLGALYVVLSRCCSITQFSIGVAFDGR